MLPTTSYDTVNDLALNPGNNFRLNSTTAGQFSGSVTANSLLLDDSTLAAGSNITLNGGGSNSSLTITSGALLFGGSTNANTAGGYTNTATIGGAGASTP